MLDERTIAVDAMTMAKYTAVLNLESALNMSNPQARQAHQRMSHDDVQIANQLHQAGMGSTSPGNSPTNPASCPAVCSGTAKTIYIITKRVSFLDTPKNGVFCFRAKISFNCSGSNLLIK